jgi:hypothetical protein
MLRWGAIAMVSSVLALTEPLRVELTQPSHDPKMLELLAPYIWPAVVVLCLLLLLRPIRFLLHQIATRATEVSIGSWATFKLPGLQEAPTDVGTQSIRDLDGTVWQESGSNLLAQFQASRTPEYALVDLGAGGEWISSRLFIFAVMLQRMKGLRCIVFVSSTPTENRRFLGCASPESVRWRLAADQPWLEAAFAQAYAGVTGPPNMLSRNSPFTDIKGALDPQVAQMVVSGFIQGLKQPPPHPNPQEFVTIRSGDEHATWISAAELERVMGTGLWLDSVPENKDDSPAANRAQVRRILDKRSPYVAQTRDGSFVSLISRIALLEEVATRVA